MQMTSPVMEKCLLPQWKIDSGRAQFRRAPNVETIHCLALMVAVYKHPRALHLLQQPQPHPYAFHTTSRFSSPKMHFKLLLATILGLSLNQVSAGGGVGTYKCGDCGCNAVDEHTWSGTSDCYTVDGSQIRAFGLSGPKSGPKTTCALFNNENCDGYGEV